MAGPAILLPSEGTVVEVNDPNNSEGYIAIPGVSAYSEQGGEAPTREVTSFEGTRAVVGSPGIGTVQITYASFLSHHPANRAIAAAREAARALQFRITTPVRPVAAAFGDGTAVTIESDGKVVFGPAPNATSTIDGTSDDLGPGLVLAMFADSGAAINQSANYAVGHRGNITYDGSPTPAFAPDQRVAFGTAPAPPSYRIASVDDAGSPTYFTLTEALSEGITDNDTIYIADSTIRVVERITESGDIYVDPRAAVTGASAFVQLLVPRLRRAFSATIQNASRWELGDQSQVGSTMTLQPSAALPEPTVLY